MNLFACPKFVLLGICLFGLALPGCAKIKLVDEISISEVGIPSGEILAPNQPAKPLPGYAIVSGGGVYTAPGVRAHVSVGELRIEGGVQTGNGVSAISGIQGALQ